MDYEIARSPTATFLPPQYLVTFLLDLMKNK